MADEKVITSKWNAVNFIRTIQKLLILQKIFLLIFGISYLVFGIALSVFGIILMNTVGQVAIVYIIEGVVVLLIALIHLGLVGSTNRAKKDIFCNIGPAVNYSGKTATMVLQLLFVQAPVSIFYLISYIRIKNHQQLITRIISAQREKGLQVPITDEDVDNLRYDDFEEEAKFLAKRAAQIEEDSKKPFDPDVVLEVRHLRKCFPLKKTITGKVTQELIAVDDVSFKLKAGETLGIVGESGCGKTTMGRAVLKLHKPSGGQIIFNGEDITNYNSAQMRHIRKQMQIIFQDPYSSLPPRSTVGGILSEPVQVHKIVPNSQVKDYVLELMDKCGLRDYYYERYPHEFSGGQRQRICIARALSVKPKLVICDEPVSALDVSIQAQIINLLKSLQKDMNLAYVFISHDLSVVKFISDKIGVMYLGSMMEFGSKEAIFSNPLHPYTQALFSAIPYPDPDVKMNRIVLQGDIPSPANPPKGCRFHTRCPYAKEVCKHVPPEYVEYEEGHFAACHKLNEGWE